MNDEESRVPIILMDDGGSRVHPHHLSWIMRRDILAVYRYGEPDTTVYDKDLGDPLSPMWRIQGTRPSVLGRGYRVLGPQSLVRGYRVLPCPVQEDIELFLFPV
mmetsp:Transcript_26461/g.25336  ORF Transcript_26461/g.25336 Transcript_26461/m.25336 type:complete len:104 (-) Transcript_26461:2048-2359(-)